MIEQAVTNGLKKHHMAIRTRKYNNKEDYELMKTLLLDNYHQQGTRFYNSINLFEYQCVLQQGKGEEYLSVDEILKDYNLYFDDEKLVGFNENESFYFLKSYEALLKLAIKETEENVLTELEWEVYSGDTLYENILLKSDYYKSKEYWTRRELDVSKFINKEINLPLGYEIDYASNCDDKEGLYEAYRFCYGFRFNQNILMNFKETSSYRQELDLVVMTSERKVVALCHGMFDSKNLLATIEAVSCYHNFRRLGLSEALQRHFIKNAEMLGAKKMTVYTAMTEKYPAPNKLYEKVGFTLTGHLNVCRKKGLIK